MRCVGISLAVALGVAWVRAAAAQPEAPRFVDLRTDAPDAEAAARKLLGNRLRLGPARVLRSLAFTHVWMQLHAPDGTPVVGAWAAVHLTGGAPSWRVRVLDEPAAVVLTGMRRIDAATAGQRAQAAVEGATGIATTEAVALPVGNGQVRPGWRFAIDAARPARLMEVWVDADDGRVEVRRDLLTHATGRGRVYRPNPVTASGDRELVDGQGTDSEALTALLEEVELRNLDGSGYLRGAYADVHRVGGRTRQDDLQFFFTRARLGFAEVSAYYHVDRLQRGLQALGFTGARSLVAAPLDVVVDATTSDQSTYDPARVQLRLGTGGIDDAEDGDVIAHEYGHAVQWAIMPNFLDGTDGMAIGEGWSDIQAYALPTESDHPALVARECLAPWDAAGYKPPQPCLRRVDGTKHYPEHLHVPREPHHDGEIWSGMLYQLFIDTGLGPSDGYRLVLESAFLYPAQVTFADASAALLAADEALYGGVHVAAIERLLVWRGLRATLAPPAADAPVLERRALALESEQPIAHSADELRIIRQPGAAALRLHFAAIDLEARPGCQGGLCDAIYLYDGAGRLYARLGGQQLDVVGPNIPGDTIYVRWVTTPSGVSNGFRIDAVDVLAAGPELAPDGGCAVGGSAKGQAQLLLIFVSLLALRWRRIAPNAAGSCSSAR